MGIMLHTVPHPKHALSTLHVMITDHFRDVFRDMSGWVSLKVATNVIKQPSTIPLAHPTAE